LENRRIMARQDLIAAFRRHSEGKRTEAQMLYRHMLGLDPGHPDALHVLGGLAHCVGENDAAIDLLNRAVQLNPAQFSYYQSLGRVYAALHMPGKAERCYRKALELNPQAIDTLISIAKIRHQQGFIEDAAVCYQKALESLPDSRPALVGLANIFKEQGRTEAAQALYERFLRIHPSAGIEIKRALLLPVISESAEAIKHCRAKIMQKIEVLKARQLIVEDPYIQVGTTNFLAAYHGLDNKNLQAGIADLYLRACPELSWSAPHCRNRITAGRKINLGIVSRFMRKHTIGHLNYGIVRHLNRKKFQVTLFCFPENEDDLSKAARQAADEVTRLPDHLKKAREMIAACKPDILFYPDIGMEPLTYFLAFSRLAPVQCTSWGHPDTTGIPNMDYYISSIHAEPPNAKEHYTEQLIRLNRYAMVCYYPDPPRTACSREQIGLPQNCTLYVCPQSLFKFHPDYDAVLKAILQNDPRGMILLFEGKHSHWTRLLQNRFDRSMPDVAGRIRFHPRVAFPDFLSLLMQADVVLDTLHFGGGYTSLLCFACGLPVVTLPGAFMRGRLTYALYKQMGIFDCVATDLRSYVDLAVTLANDPSLKKAVSEKIRRRSSVLFEDLKAVRELEQFFEWSLQKLAAEATQQNFNSVGAAAAENSGCPHT